MKKIVVIEDQQLMGSIYRTKFAAEGFKVEVAEDGEAGLALINQTKPNLVLLDWMLPKLNGVEVLKKLRANPATQSLPVILFSSSLLQSMIEEAWKEGATAVLSKATHSPKLVVEVVRQALLTAESSAETTVVSAGDNAGESATGTRVLLIEAHAVLREILVHLLAQAGHQVTVAQTVSAICSQTPVEPFDLLLMGEGYDHEDMARLLERCAPKPAPVVLYCATSAAPAQPDWLKAHAAHFLSKPEDLLDIGKLVSKLTAARVTVQAA